MKYLILICGSLFWLLGGQINHWFRRLGLGFAVALISYFYTQSFWVIAYIPLMLAATSLGYGDEPTDKPRWVCGLAYGFATLPILWGLWDLWIAQMLIASVMTWLINDVFPIKSKVYMAESLTGLFAVCVIPFAI